MKARLANAGKNIECELMWTFSNGVLSRGILVDHVAVLWDFQ